VRREALAGREALGIEGGGRARDQWRAGGPACFAECILSSSIFPRTGRPHGTGDPSSADRGRALFGLLIVRGSSHLAVRAVMTGALAS
jgi:hypothetical protein